MIPSAPKVPESALLTPSTVHRALCDLVSDVTSSSSVEISVHYIFGLSESSRMRSALQGKHGKHGKAKQSGSPISGEQAVQHLLSVNVCEETNVCGTFLAEICFKTIV